MRSESTLMAKFNPITFMQEVRQEVAKVTWPTWKEVWITTVMVLIMVALASIFFLLVDQVLSHVVRLVLGVGS
jgi:preprotein translocase subunit SecE